MTAILKLPFGKEMSNSDSLIPLTGARLVQLVEAAKAEWETVIASSLAEMLERAEKRMREPRWLGRGPWLTTEGPPSDEQIELWNERRAKHHDDVFCPRAIYQRKLDTAHEWLNRFLKAEKHMEHGGTFLLSMSDYEKITGKKEYTPW